MYKNMIGTYNKIRSRKEVGDKKLHSTQFYFYYILEPTKLINVYGNKNEVSMMWEWDLNEKGTRKLCGD